jgi:hypothetical protein
MGQMPTCFLKAALKYSGVEKPVRWAISPI